MLTAKALAEAISRQMGVDERWVQHIVRQLINAGVMPKSAPRAPKVVTPRQAVEAMIAVAATTGATDSGSSRSIKEAPDTLKLYGGLITPVRYQEDHGAIDLVEDLVALNRSALEQIFQSVGAREEITSDELQNMSAWLQIESIKPAPKLRPNKAGRYRLIDVLEFAANMNLAGMLTGIPNLQEPISRIEFVVGPFQQDDPTWNVIPEARLQLRRTDTLYGEAYANWLAMILEPKPLRFDPFASFIETGQANGLEDKIGEQLTPERWSGYISTSHNLRQPYYASRVLDARVLYAIHHEAAGRTEEIWEKSKHRMQPTAPMEYHGDPEEMWAWVEKANKRAKALLAKQRQNKSQHRGGGES